MPDRRNVAPVSWRGGDNVGGTTSGGAGTTSGSGGRSGVQIAGIASTSPVSAAASITGVTPYRMVLTASTTSQTILLPYSGSVVSIVMQGGTAATFTVYIAAVASHATVALTASDYENFAAGDVPFNAGETMYLVSSVSQTVDVYVYVTFLS